MLGIEVYVYEGTTSQVYPWMSELFNGPLESEVTF